MISILLNFVAHMLSLSVNMKLLRQIPSLCLVHDAFVLEAVSKYHLEVERLIKPGA